jgi:hypothetical protein
MKMTTDKSAFLYFLFAEDGRTFKIGKAVDVLGRMQKLPDRIDVKRSRCVEFLPNGWASTSSLALRVERFVQLFSKRHHLPRVHGGDGYTEWYDVAAYDQVIQFIEVNRTFLGCSAIQEIPVRETRQIPINPLTKPFVAKNKKAPKNEAAIFERNKALYGDLCLRLKNLKNSGCVIGWFGDWLVLWKLKDEEFPWSYFFESVYGGVHFVGSQMRYGDIYLARFVNRESWRGDFMRFGIESREELIAAAMEIQNVPLDCCDDLRYLVEVSIFSWWGEGASPEEEKVNNRIRQIERRLGVVASGLST